jgi:hypothetical protein
MNFGYGIVLIKIWLQKHICKKSGSALISPDKHKTLQERRRFLPSFLEWLMTEEKRVLFFPSRG